MRVVEMYGIVLSLLMVTLIALSTKILRWNLCNPSLILIAMINS